jgi:hypothetical protein
MTGIYLGAATTLLWLASARRLQWTRPPTRGVMVILGLFAWALGTDGINALLTDLGFAHPYTPGNDLRLVTGILGGTTLGVAIGWLLASALRPQSPGWRRIIAEPWELIPPIAFAGILGLLAKSGLPSLYAPFAVGLLLAALLVVSALSMALIALLWDRGWSSLPLRERAPLAATSVVVASLAIGALSGLRIVLERALDLPRLT